MIKKLRIRFVVLVMESFLAVLVLILLGVNLINTHNVYAGIDRRLDYLAESEMGPPVGMIWSTPPVVRGWVDQNQTGMMNESSYFIFTGFTTGSILEHQLEVLTEATGKDGAALIESILASSKERGDVGDYRYFVADRGTPYRLVLLRCESEFASIRSLWNTSLLVGLISLVLVLLLAALLSGTATRPFADNIERQRRFISNASHELKTPLGVIMSDLDMQILEGGETEWLQNAQLQADHLAILIEQLTAYSLLGESKQHVAAIPVDISALGEDILEAFRPLALSKGQTVSSDIEPGVSVTGNDDALRTLLSVLMDNAVKYAPEGGSIFLSVRQEKKAVIELTNTCADVSDIDLDHLFERFYRAPGQRAAQDGHGLGLSIAQEIVSLYGGTIRARCGDDSITFTVEI